MEIHTLQELLTAQQNQILSLSVHVDCLIEELESSGVLDTKKLDKRMRKKLKEIQAIANKLREQKEETLPPMFNYGGTIGEA